ncbi:unnamed protein product [Cylicocyclus nassatus]|uniref:Uncharacterized protein n=1 Tax=Cylicocyclus nassatus TaxID=53992 RepID=A0AA36M7B3_CYLNA|nr:unnamed protein product [Cylicocyclus nassatus]
MEGTSLSMPNDFVLAAALALALQSQQNQGDRTAADTTMSDAAYSMQRSPSTWTLHSSDMSVESIMPNFASTPILSQEHGVNSDMRGETTSAFYRNEEESNTIENELENDLELVNDEADRRAGIIRPAQSTATPQSKRSRSRYGRRLKQPMNCTISTCLEETMASDTQLTTVSQRTDTRKSLKSRKFWEKMFELQSQWIQKILSSSYSRSAFAAQVLECWKMLMKAYSSLSSRPVDLQKCLQLYVVDAVKLLEHGVQRGYSEVATLMVEFINVVVSAFLKNSRHLSEFSSCWIQTREILRIICETPTNMNVLCGLSTTIDELKLNYLKKRATDAVILRDDALTAYIKGLWFAFLSSVRH